MRFSTSIFCFSVMNEDEVNSCKDACDSDDSGTDDINILRVLFLEQGTVPAPGPLPDESHPCCEGPTESAESNSLTYTSCRGVSVNPSGRGFEAKRPRKHCQDPTPVDRRSPVDGKQLTSQRGGSATALGVRAGLSGTTAPRRAGVPCRTSISPNLLSQDE